MSWSLSLLGPAADVNAAIDSHSAGLTGQSKTEFDTVKDAIKLLVGQNVSVNPNNPINIQLTASGHTVTQTVPPDPNVSGSVATTKTGGTCTVNITQVQHRILGNHGLGLLRR